MAIKTYEGEVIYEGCVIRTWEHNGYEDSDFYADVVDIESGTIKTIEYATTRFGGGGTAVEDLTPENYRAFLHNAFRNQLALLISEDKKKATELCSGKEVEVVAGRKVPIGTRGTVFWLKEVNYDPYGRWFGKEVKIGIKGEDGIVYWTYAKNVKLVNESQYFTPVQELVKRLKQKRSKSYLRLKAVT